MFLIDPYRFAAAATDPNFANVSLLLHGDASPLVDSSGTPKVITPVGNAAYSTAQAKFGSGSIAFDGSGSYLSLNPTIPDLNLGFGSCTIECWIWTVNYSTAAGETYWPIVTKGAPFHIAAEWTQSYAFYYSPQEGNRLVLRHRNNAGSFAEGTHMFTKRSSVLNLLHNTWYHVAAVRDGNDLRLYLNGANATDTTTGNYDWSNFNFGLNSVNDYFNVARTRGGTDNVFWDSSGYIDELRITKGVARYTGNFTPPTAPFPDS